MDVHTLASDDITVLQNVFKLRLLTHEATTLPQPLPCLEILKTMVIGLLEGGRLWLISKWDSFYGFINLSCETSPMMVGLS